MKKEIQETTKWFAGLVMKYGIIVGIIMALYFGIKKVWFWVLMPSMLLVVLQQFGPMFGWGWTAALGWKSLVISWVFLFSVLSYLFVRKDE